MNPFDGGHFSPQQVPVLDRFTSEGRDLQKLLNASKQADGAAGAPIAREIVVRAGRLAALSELQAQFNAEQGEMRLMRLWQAKAVQLRLLRSKHLKLVQAVQSRGGERGTAAAAEGTATEAAKAAEAAVEEATMEPSLVVDGGDGGGGTAAASVPPRPEPRTPRAAPPPAFKGMGSADGDAGDVSADEVRAGFQQVALDQTMGLDHTEELDEAYDAWEAS